MTKTKLHEIYLDFVAKTRVTEHVLEAFEFGWFHFD